MNIQKYTEFITLSFGESINELIFSLKCFKLQSSDRYFIKNAINTRFKNYMNNN